MSIPRGNGQNGGHYYSNITQPTKIDLNFVVDSTNGNGLGIRSLKSNGYVRNVFMHTSATPGSNDGALNPNPASGLILVQFKNSFNYYLGGFSGFVSPLSGTPLTSTTSGVGYVIVSLGTTTLAQWQAAGVPQGLTPSVGMAFVAIATGAIGGTGAVETPSSSGIMSLEVVGDPNQSIRNSNVYQNGGAYLLLQALNTSDAQTAPANNTVIGMSAFFDLSSVSIPDSSGGSGL
jgi:hypothetical protein